MKLGDISLEIQTKLLRFLEEREFERVGGTRSISVDIRIIAATNRNLVTLVKGGAFREDLFHRLNVVSVELPPLRDRREDIPVLSSYFLQKYSIESGRNFTQISEEAQTKLIAYEWPGNVRELANVIERAVVLGIVPEVGIEDLPGRIVGTNDGPIEELSYYGALNTARREVLLKALSQTQGNRAAAAKTLGLNPKYFFKLMKSLGIVCD